ncbi:DUF4175 domain-containing protein [Nocardia ninae]|uniref:Uncharacterized protein n=1 Tax=Nocardia ninae NBRC 108245 TaxID=1210091 RepID=A0A511MUD3_9NOCA|nr:hypothetical protein [Nocardia ninae]GEM43828.1 hypothetical protein NN4_83470 [Nocardia ninae NBRC 108245]
MSLIWLIALVVLVLLVAWWLFPMLARILGFLIVIDALLGIVLFPSYALPARLPWLAGGVALWLAGHWAWAAKHGAWGSRLARSFFGLPGFRHLIPRSVLLN